MKKIRIYELEKLSLYLRNSFLEEIDKIKELNFKKGMMEK